MAASCGSVSWIPRDSIERSVKGFLINVCCNCYLFWNMYINTMHNWEELTTIQISSFVFKRAVVLKRGWFANMRVYVEQWITRYTCRIEYSCNKQWREEGKHLHSLIAMYTLYHLGRHLQNFCSVCHMCQTLTSDKF